MKKYILACILQFIATGSLCSQNADERIAKLLNQGDWFALDKDYGELKDSLQNDFLKQLTKGLLGYYFNRPNEALEGIETLLAHHSDEMNGQGIQYAILLSTIYGEKGNYGLASQNIEDVLKQYSKEKIGKESWEGLKEIGRFYECLKEVPAPYLTRPDSDIHIPIEIEKVKLPISFEPKGWRGTHILIPVSIHNKSYRFIFDTGAGTSFMSAEMAQEVGVQKLNDSMLINPGTAGAKMGGFGTLPEMKIGPITFHNALVAIAPSNALDSIIKIDAVLGMDFINLFEEIHIYPQEQMIVFPKKGSQLSATGRNLIKVNRSINLKAEIDGEELLLQLDTGNSTGELEKEYYDKHKEELDLIGKRERINGGGFNHVTSKEILRLPSITLTIGDQPVTLADFPISLSEKDSSQETMGNIGMSLVNTAKCFILNLKEMFIKIE